MLTSQELAQLIDPDGKKTKAGGGRYKVRCPAHDDRNPSMTVWVDDKGKAALNCFAGCAQDAIVAALAPHTQETIENTWRPAPVTVLLPRRRHTPTQPVKPGSPNIESEHPYVNDKGETAYVIRRFAGKKIRQFHQQNGHLVTGRGDHPLIPYRLPDVLAAKQAGDTIYIVEGEKDADTLATAGLTATTNAMGVYKWKPELNQWFTGANVVILPDNDQPGREHATEVHQHLSAVANTARIVTLPDLDDKGDVTDWLKTHTVEELEQLAHRPPAPTGLEFHLSGGDIIFDIPLEVESIWGRGQESLWAVGEPLMIYGPTGIGKTTLAGRLLLARIGVDLGDLLGYPVAPIAAGHTILYVAADRPRQAMRSLRRMAPAQAASLLAERLRIEHFRQIWASDKDPEMLYRAATQANATAVFIDSAKDLAGGPLKDEGPAKSLMDAIQICIANSIDVVLLHHPRKATQEGANKRELDIDDVYGSAWLTAGVGSVLLVDGKPGSGTFRFEQLKAPATFVPSMEVAVDYETGTLTRRTTRDLDIWIKDMGTPVTVRAATAYKLNIAEETVDTDSGEYKRVKRHIEDLEKDGLVVQADPKGNAKRYQWYENANTL